MSWTTCQRGQKRKKEVKALKPHVYFNIIIIFIFQIPLISSWKFSKKLGHQNLREGLTFWEATGNWMKEKLSALWKGSLFSFWYLHFCFFQKISSSKISGWNSIQSDQVECLGSYWKWKVNSFWFRKSVNFYWKMILCLVFSSSIFPPISPVLIDSNLEWKEFYLKYEAEGII